MSSSQGRVGRKRMLGGLLVLVIAAAALAALLPAAARNLESIIVVRDVVGGEPIGLHRLVASQHPRAGLWRAALAAETGDWETVLFQVLPLAAEGNVPAMQYAARAYEALGDFERAVELWQASRNVEALLAMGLSAQQNGLLEAARAAYAAAWELDPRDSATRLALVLEQLGDSAAAERVYLESIERVGPGDRRLPGWYRGLGRLYTARGQWQEAIGAYANALEAARFEPNFEVDRAHYELAGVYLNAGQVEAALMQIAAALQLNQHPDYLFRAGQIYEAAGLTEDALRAYRQVLAVAPGNQQALDAVERLESGE